MIKSSGGMTVTPLRTAMTSPTVPPQHKQSSRISNFSVASLLADTRPKSPIETILIPGNLSSQSISPPLSHPDSNSTKNERLTHTPHSSHTDSDVDYDSNQEDSIVDIEDVNQETNSPTPEHNHLNKSQILHSQSLQGGHHPIRPTPFSALAAAAVAWGGMGGSVPWPGARQISPFGPPGLFPGQSFGPGPGNGGEFSKTIKIYSFNIYSNAMRVTICSSIRYINLCKSILTKCLTIQNN